MASSLVRRCVRRNLGPWTLKQVQGDGKREAREPHTAQTIHRRKFKLTHHQITLLLANGITARNDGESSFHAKRRSVPTPCLPPPQCLACPRNPNRSPPPWTRIRPHRPPALPPGKPLSMSRSIPAITVSRLGWSTPDGRAVLSNLDLRFAPERTGIVEIGRAHV